MLQEPSFFAPNFPAGGVQQIFYPLRERLLASALVQAHGNFIPAAIPVFALERIMAEDVKLGMLWLRSFRAFENFLQTEPDLGAMSH